MKIVMLDALTLGEFDISAFEKLGEFTSYGFTKPCDVVSRCLDASIVITNKVVLDSTILNQLKNLKLICISATGMNNIDLECAKSLNIEVKNVVGYSTKSVAQHTLMLALALLGKLGYYDKYVKSAAYTKSDIFCHLPFLLGDLNGKNWGIIGLGSIGKEVANLAKAFGANLSYYSTSGKNINQEIPHKQKEELLAHSDIISIHAPLNESTKDLIKADSLNKLKKGAILLNLGRGGIINEDDLALALKTRDLYFGSDVLVSEPMVENHPFLEIFNTPSLEHKILITPHIAWAYEDSKKELIAGVIKNINTFKGDINGCN